jgi:hypothetical protein
MRMSLGIVVTFLSAAGCAPAPDQARHTVEEYRQDSALRRQEMQSCTDDPGALGNSPDCVNALSAERAAGVGRLQDLPPLKLPGKP